MHSEGMWPIRLGTALAAVVAAVVLAVVADGCGSSHVTVATATVQVSAEDRVGASNASESEAQTSEEISWGAPSAEILTVFDQAKQALGGRAVFVPTQLPLSAEAASAVVSNVEATIPAVSRVIVETAEGYLLFAQGLQGDIGDLPHQAVGRVGDCVAAEYQVMGGTLVQWSCDGVWYAVFGEGVAESTVVKVALAMKKQ